MEIKYLAQENEIQKIYNDLGLIVPVGDLSTTKAPAIQPLPTSSTQTTVTAQFNVMSGGDITALSYKVNDGAAVSLTPAKGVVTITLEDLEYNSGPYEIELTATNATGSTVTSSTIDLQHYTNWATADEVLDGNKFIGEDGEEHVGEYVVPEPTYVGLNISPSTQEQTFDPASEQADGFDRVTVYGVTSSIDANITAGNIKNGVTILGVTGNYQGGPSTGGAVLTSLECGEDQEMGMPYVNVNFETLPSPMDFANHTYFIQVVAETVTAISDPISGTTTPVLKYDQILALDMGMPSSANVSPNYSWHMDANTLSYGFTASWLPVDTTDALLPSTPAKVYIYEDDITNVKFIISGTLVNIDLNN